MPDDPWTPGPWKVSSTGRDILTADGAITVAWAYEKDAPLIAVAPEMAYLLFEFWAMWENPDIATTRLGDIAEQAQSLLARARGEA